MFATEVDREVLQAVDFEAILADEPAEDPIDVDRLADAIGRPVGRVLVDHVVGGNGATGLATRAIGSEVGGRVAAKTFRVAVENVETGTVAETLVELDEETLPGPTFRELLGPHAEAAGALAFDPGESADGGGRDTGGDAAGIHDTAGVDHGGVLDETDVVGEPDGGVDTDDWNGSLRD